MKPLCKFCGGHHYEGEEHPEEAVREALAELRRTEPAESEFAVGRRTIDEVKQHVERVTGPPVTVRPEPVEAPVTVHPEPQRTVTAPKRTVTRNRAWEAKNRDKVREANADRQRAYRARQEG